MFRRLTSGILIALAAAACGGQPPAGTQAQAQAQSRSQPRSQPQSQPQSQATPAAPASQTAANQQALPEPILGYERVRQFHGRAKRVFGGARMTLFEVTDRAQPEIKSMVHKELGLGAFELGEETTRQTGDSWLVGYDVRFKGIRVATASADATLGVNDSDVRELRARNVPTAGVDGMESTVSTEAAIAIAKGQSARAIGISADSPTLVNTKPELVFEAGRQESDKAQLCWLVTVSVNDDVRPHRVEYAIKAIGEPVVVRTQDLVREDHFGTVSGVRWEGTPLQTTVERTLPFVRLSRTSPAADSAADATGKYRFTGTGAATVRGSLISPFFRVTNTSTIVRQLEPSGAGSDAAPIDVKFAASHEYEIAQVSAFFWAHRARTFAGTALGASDLRGVEVRVNIDGTCNSYFTAPDTPNGNAVLLLFRSGPMNGNQSRICVNRAYADTIFHEYGHGIDWFHGKFAPGFGGAAYAEGFADAMAILFTRSNCYGRDAAGPKTCLRPADNTIEWPGSGIGDKHVAGQIYSGFVFELVQALKASMSEEDAYELARKLTINAAMRNPTTIQQAVDYTIFYDDNDGDRRNGTPHLAAIKKAALKKKLWKAEWDPTT